MKGNKIVSLFQFLGETKLYMLILICIYLLYYMYDDYMFDDKNKIHSQTKKLQNKIKKIKQIKKMNEFDSVIFQL